MQTSVNIRPWLGQWTS